MIDLSSKKMLKSLKRINTIKLAYSELINSFLTFFFLQNTNYIIKKEKNIIFPSFVNTVLKKRHFPLFFF